MNPILKSYYDTANSFTEQEFGAFFQRSRAGNGNWVWKLKKSVITDCDRFFINLPNYAQSLDQFIKLVVNHGILIKEKNGRASRDGNNSDFNEFLGTMPEGDKSFLWELIRIYKTKGNALLNLVQQEDGSLIWDIYTPDRFAIETKAQDEKTAKNTIANVYYLPQQGKPTLIEEIQNLILVKANPSGILGVPPIIFNSYFSNAIISDVKKFAQAKQNGAYKKQFLSPLKVEVASSGQKTYRKLSASKDNNELAQLREDVNRALSDAYNSIQITDVEFTASEISPMEADRDFIELYPEAYAMHVAKLTGLAPYMVMAKEPNRSVTEQQYKEMIQMQIQPLNNYFTNIIKKMYQVWCQATGKTTSLDLTLENPKASLDMVIDGPTLYKLLSIGAVDLDEIRNMIGLENATDEVRSRFETRINTLPIPKTA